MSGLVYDQSYLCSSCLKGLPSQLVDHITYAGCVVVPSQDKARSAVLYHLDRISEDLHVEVSDGTTVFSLKMDLVL